MMARPPITDAQIETLKNAFRNGASVDAAAKAASVSWASAKKYESIRDQYESYRDEKRHELIATTAAEYVPQLLDAIGKYIAHIGKPEVVAETSARDSIIIIGTAVDKVQLLTGQATERSEHVDATDARNRLVARVDEIASRRTAHGDHGDERGAG